MFQNFHQQRANHVRRRANALRRGMRRRPGEGRQGVAAVEAAFCIPVVVILMMGTLEVCSGIFLSESLTVSAYEACRAGIRRRSTAEDVYDRAVEVLAERNVSMPTDDNGDPVGITIEPSDFSELDALDPIKITITAPTSGNSIYIFDSFYDRSVTVSVSMVREFDE